jgi:TonB family protein
MSLRPRENETSVFSWTLVRQTAATLLVEFTPIYCPPVARQARVTGTVTLHVTVGSHGLVTGVDVASGHPFLAEAAKQPVLNWKFASLKNSSDFQIECVFAFHGILEDGSCGATFVPAPQQIRIETSAAMGRGKPVARCGQL